MPTASKKLDAPEDEIVWPAPAMSPSTYVKGSHTAGIRADHDAKRTTLLARQEVVQAERQRCDDELADIDLGLKLCSEPVLESNVTAIRIGAA